MNVGNRLRLGLSVLGLPGILYVDLEMAEGSSRLLGPPTTAGPEVPEAGRPLIRPGMAVGLVAA